ncbi:MAG: M20/M25/M40 family metallo-hydrolase [Candidatus Cloacimonetes bacterium]|nr:M20/M25/M40 family metallo-hydrolase [Candidatus Cloacimonadota bacterium]
MNIYKKSFINGLLSSKCILLFAIIITLTSFLQSQTIVRIDKETNVHKNLLESMNLNLCFEMDDFIVVAVESLDLLREKNIKYVLLTMDISIEPLYIVSTNRFVELHSESYFGEIVINEPFFRVERINYNDIDRLNTYLNDGVKFIPVMVSERYYRNIKTSLFEDMLSDFTIANKYDILNSVNSDSIAWFMQGLEDFETRFAFHPNRFEVSQWIADQFIRFGYTDVELDSFYAVSSGVGTYQTNVIATLEGAVFPERYVIVGAHHDSINSMGNTMVYAPGSNDNASGVAAVLEIARVMKLHDYQPTSTVRFVTLAMEELGLHGAYHDARKLSGQNKNVAAMINSDMISYSVSPNWTFRAIRYPGADFLTNLALQKGNDLQMNITSTTEWNSRSDSWAYHTEGYPAIFFHIGDEDPYYHTGNDTFVNQNILYTEQYIKLIGTVTMYVLEMLDSPKDFLISDTGTGHSLYASWEQIAIPSVTYRLTVRNTVNQYVTNYETTDDSFLLTDLTEGVMYEITLFAINNESVSPGSTRFATPLSIPRRVVDFNHTPLLNKISFTWTENQELDLAGYRIYRREEIADFIEIDSISKESSSWIDTTTTDTTWYEYKINAFDNDGNIGPDSDIIKTRHLTFNGGILVVDLTANSLVNPLIPPESEVTDFYRNILSGYDINEIKYGLNERIRIEDLGIFSDFIIHKNSVNTTRSQNLEEMMKIIIEYGGNILYTAFDPLHYLNNAFVYPVNYDIGDFPKDYFQIETVNSNTSARFSAGVSSGWKDIPNLEVDSTKIPENLNGKLNRMEVFTGSGFEVLYTYSSESTIPTYQVNNPESAFDGIPVAIYTTREKSHLFLTSIPLYFIKHDQARDFLRTVLKTFEEELSSDVESNLPLVFEGLNLQNYPNPFNPLTTIEFSLTTNDFVEINIFNIRGQLVKSYPQEMFPAGKNTVQWDGINNYGNTMSSGIYLYQVKTSGGLSAVSRMVFLK